MPKTPEELTAQIVRLLYENGAPQWAVRDKGVLVAAVKLQLSERVQRDQERNK